MGVQIRPAPLPQFQLDPDFKESFNKKELQLHPKFNCHHSLVLVITTEEEGKADQEGKKGGWKENEREQGEKEMLSFTWMPFVLLLTVTSMGWPQDEYTGGSGVQKCVRLDQIPAARGLGGHWGPEEYFL